MSVSLDSVVEQVVSDARTDENECVHVWYGNEHAVEFLLVHKPR